MIFTIGPDPRYPLGGHALLVLPEGAATGSGRMALRRLYDNWHLGAHGWQAAETTLGPFTVTPRGSEFAVALGPEIVDHLEEFTVLEIVFEGGSRGRASWPEDVLPSPGRAVPGGLRRTEREGGELPPGAVQAGSGDAGTADGDAARTGAEAARPDADSAETAPTAVGQARSRPAGGAPPRRGVLVGLAVAAILLCAAAAAWFLYGDRFFEGEPDEEAALVACTEEAFAATADLATADPASRIEWVRRCGGIEGVTAETRLAAVEQALGQSPEALIVMGRWYDPAHREADFTPFDAPALENAARYYFEAKERGAVEAEALLQDACARLDSTDIMQDNAHHLYCPEE